MKLDTEARDRGALDQGAASASASALLATGANVRRLRVDGGDLEGIHYLRALGNAAVDPRATPSRPSASC